MAKRTQNLVAAGTEALFASDLEPSARLTAWQIRQAISATLRRLGGVMGCAAVVDERFSEQPELAAERLTWAHSTLRQLAYNA